MIEIRHEHLSLILSILQRHVAGYDVRAYGSRVNGGSKPYSDLDLVVMTNEPIPPRTMAILKDDLTESDLPFKVDVIDWATASDSFREVIRNKFEIVQTAVTT